MQGWRPASSGSPDSRQAAGALTRCGGHPGCSGGETETQTGGQLRGQLVNRSEKAPDLQPAVRPRSLAFPSQAGMTGFARTQPRPGPRNGLTRADARPLLAPAGVGLKDPESAGDAGQLCRSRSAHRDRVLGEHESPRRVELSQSK